MDYDFQIALYTTLIDTKQLRLGHLWHTARSGQAPDWFGQPWPGLDSVFREQSIEHRIGTHEFSVASDVRKKKSTGILSSVLRSFGVTDFQMYALTQRSFSARIVLTDYVRPSISRAALTRIIGMPLPPVYEGGHWFACYAQHQATSGSLELAYDRSDGYDLAVELEGAPALAGLTESNDGGPALAGHTESNDGGPARGAQPGSISADTSHTAGLHLASQSAGVQLYSFHAEKPLVFGVSLQHLWEKDGKLSHFGDKHRDVDYTGS
jgi:hypothetical protein